MKDEHKRYTLRLPVSLFNLVKQDAQKLNIPLSSMFRIILSEYYKNKI